MNTSFPKETGWFTVNGTPCEAESPEWVVTEWNGVLRTRNDQGGPVLVKVGQNWVPVS